MVTLEKVFTREFPILLNQIWGRAYDSFFYHKLKTFPKQVFIMLDGMTEIYRNPNLYIELHQEFYNLYKKDKQYFKKFYKKSLIKFNILKKIYNKPYLSKKELINFYQLSILFWSGMYAAIYIPKHSELFVKSDRDLMVKLRKKIDVYADKATGIILRSLEHILINNQVDPYYVTYEDLLNNKIIKRKKTICLIDGDIVKKNKYNQLKKKYKFVLEKNIIKKNKIIKGNVAYRGVITGKVFLLNRRADINKIKKGNILVTYMTIPDYIPAMKKAAAFVTDEGGITCHAAVIAREMKKPCIIGTKFASKVLNNGNLVQVDANKGIIRKISS